MVGLLDFLGTNNPVQQWVAPRRNALGGLGMGLASGRTLSEGLALGTQGMVEGRQADTAYATAQKAEQDRQQELNKTLEYLRTNAPDLAEMVAVGMPVNQAWGEAVRRQQQAQAGGKDATYFGTPIWGTDAEGNAALGQLNNQGQFQLTEMPEGFSVGKDPIRLDAGTHHVLLDPVTRQQIGIIPKENFQEAYDTAAGSTEGKAAAENRVNAPQAVATAENTLRSIDGLLEDPMLGMTVGPWGWVPNAPGVPQAGTISRIEQLQGQAFLQAFDTLKGGGQITEVEGTKATNAIARLQRSQNEEDFRAALMELREIVLIARERARMQAQGGGTPGQGMPQPSAPQGQPQRLRFDPTTGEFR